MPWDLGRLGLSAGAYDVTKGAMQTLKAWLPSAVAALNQDGFSEISGPLAAPITYGRIPVEVLSQTADQVPCVYCSSTGTVGRALKAGQHTSYGAWYNLNVAVVDRDDDWESTADRVQVWAGLIRAVILSIPNLSGFVQDTEFASESFGVIPADDGRTYAGCVVVFNSFVPNITVPGDVGPMTPPPGVIDPTTGLTPPLGPVPYVTSHQEAYFSGPAS